MASANNATTPAPRAPAATPAATQLPRPATPRVAASTMPMMRPASITSRKTMTSAPSISLLRDHHALGGVGVELADELVAARIERADPHQALGLAGDDLLDLECGAVEFFRRGILVAHVDRHALAGGNANLRRFELVVANDQVELLRGRGRARHGESHQRGRGCELVHHVPGERHAGYERLHGQ